MQFQDAPNVNGLMELTDTQKADIKGKLVTIKNDFEPSMEQPTCDTFYLVSTYNKDNTDKINGDTAEMILNEQEDTDGS